MYAGCMLVTSHVSGPSVSNNKTAWARKLFQDPLDATYVSSLCSILLDILHASIIVALDQLETKPRHLIATRYVEKKPDRSAVQGSARVPFLSIYDNKSSTLAGKFLKKPQVVFYFRLSKSYWKTMKNWYVTGPFSQELPCSLDIDVGHQNKIMWHVRFRNVPRCYLILLLLSFIGYLSTSSVRKSGISSNWCQDRLEIYLDIPRYWLSILRWTDAIS